MEVAAQRDASPYLNRFEDFFEFARKIGQEFFEGGAGVVFADGKGMGGAFKVATKNLLRVMHETLARGQRIDGECESVNQRVPALGAVFINSGHVTGEHAFATQRGEALKLELADAAAGVSEGRVTAFARDGFVERDEFLAFVAGGVIVSAINGWPFMFDEYLTLVSVEELAQRGEARGHGGVGQLDTGVAGAKLIEQSAQIAQQAAAIRRGELGQSVTVSYA